MEVLPFQTKGEKFVHGDDHPEIGDGLVNVMDANGVVVVINVSDVDVPSETDDHPYHQLHQVRVNSSCW